MTTVAIERSKVEKAKYRQRIERRAARDEAGTLGVSSANMPEKIILERKGGQWWAHTDKHQQTINVTCDNTPDAALNRLMIQMNVRMTDPGEIVRLTGLVHSMRAPSCEVKQFAIKPDLDGNQRYVVDFTSNVRLTRGDFERLFSARMRRGDMDVERTGSDG